PVEKYSSNPSTLFPMGKKEIIVCPLFELRIVGGMVFVAHLLELMMKILGISFVYIMWSKVYPAPKPRNAIAHFKIAYIHMDYGYHRAFGVHDYRDSCGKKISRGKP